MTDPPAIFSTRHLSSHNTRIHIIRSGPNSNKIRQTSPHLLQTQIKRIQSNNETAEGPECKTESGEKGHKLNAANSWLERHNPFKAVIFSLLAFPPQKIRCTFPANQNTFNINGIHWRGNRHKLKICLARGENVMACRTAFQVVSVHLIFISPRPPQRLLLSFFSLFNIPAVGLALARMA